ncbi:MAG: sulfite exporter TauE/SafE family protein [Candidatus Deferrimicrobiaceae bacterium]
MDAMFITVVLAFALSFLFALGGIGSAIALVPVLHWLGVPFAAAKPTGLMVNTLSMTGASYSNIRNRRLDFRMGLPIIITSAILAPVGAWCTTIIPRSAVLVVFIGFLVFSGSMLLFFRNGKFAEQYRDDHPIAGTAATGAAAGFLSGLLGVGGGGLISPLLIFMGFNPKKVAAITAFAVPFSSFIGFVAYAMMGTVQWQVLIAASLAAYGGGFLGTGFMQGRLAPGTVKKLLGVVLFGLAAKMIVGLVGG